MNSKKKLSETEKVNDTVLSNTYGNPNQTSKQDSSTEAEGIEVKDEELVKVEKVEGTPFVIVTMEGKSAVMLGKYRLSDHFERIEEAREDSLRTDWERVMAVTSAQLMAMEELAKYKEYANKTGQGITK